MSGAFLFWVPHSFHFHYDQSDRDCDCEALGFHSLVAALRVDQLFQLQ